MAREFSKQFYNSIEWRMTREYCLRRDKYLCRKCGAPAEEVHHIIHLTPNNIGDVSITMNPNNLVCLCKACHFEEHYRDKAEGHRTGTPNTEIDSTQYTFDSTGQLIQIPPYAGHNI